MCIANMHPYVCVCVVARACLLCDRSETLQSPPATLSGKMFGN